jgi:hypothetical protein
MPPQRIREPPVAVAAVTHLFAPLRTRYQLSFVEQPLAYARNMIRRYDPRRDPPVEGCRRGGAPPSPSSADASGSQDSLGRLDPIYGWPASALPPSSGSLGSAPRAAHLPTHAAAGIEPAARRDQIADTAAVRGQTSTIDAAAREAAGQQDLAVAAGVGATLGHRLGGQRYKGPPGE